MSMTSKSLAEQAGYSVSPRDGTWAWRHRGGQESVRYHTAVEAWDDAAGHAFENRRVAIEAYAFLVDGSEVATVPPLTSWTTLASRLRTLRQSHGPDARVQVMRRGIADITPYLEGRLE